MKYCWKGPGVLVVSGTKFAVGDLFDDELVPAAAKFASQGKAEIVKIPAPVPAFVPAFVPAPVPKPAQDVEESALPVPVVSPSIETISPVPEKRRGKKASSR
jgi:hypothetical protein